MEEIHAALGLPALGVVPSMSRKEGPAIRGKKAYLDSKSMWAETYRTMRTAVLFSASKARSRTILVTSPEAADGKSTVVSNLAIAMAQAGQKTLVLEADFRKPMQSKIFGVNHNNNKGLASVLAGTYELEEVINKTCVSGLDLLTCGPDVPNPSETLHSDNFNKLIKLLAKQYDRIIVDSPPVLPVTDAQILASICQLTILVLRAEKSTRKASKQALDALLRVGARIPGVVVNDVPKNGRFGYYGGDGYYKDNTSSRRMSGFQRSEMVDKRQELCARLGNSASQRIVEIASPKKKILAANRKSAAVKTASDETENLNDSGSKNIAERQIMLPGKKKAVTKRKEPVEAFEGT
jgi:capsular exopolysaccharide synthesis family protein